MELKGCEFALLTSEHPRARFAKFIGRAGNGGEVLLNDVIGGYVHKANPAELPKTGQ